MDGSSPTPRALRRIRGVLRRCAVRRAGYLEWEVETDEGPCRAISIPSLSGPLAEGDPVLLNGTAVALALGTGGYHYVICRLAPPEEPPEEFPGRQAGHLLKLRYTPLQHRVLAAEEEASPHRRAVEQFTGLEGMPVLAAELHSQAAAAAVAARAAAPGLRIALLMLDSAALPLAISRLAARLRADGTLAATITAGQAFGGDYEAVNVYSGLVTARAAAGAELVIATQGPGNAGTGTEYGFSGLALVEALHACDALGGTPALAPRMSEADPRDRHRGLSHHTTTSLRCLRVAVAVPLCAGEHPELPGELRARHTYPAADPAALMPALAPYREMLTTMGRGLEEDRLFFRAAAAAGAWAAGTAASMRGGKAS